MKDPKEESHSEHTPKESSLIADGESRSLVYEQTVSSSLTSLGESRPQEYIAH